MPASSQTSLLFTLPLEIRQLIYTHLFHESVKPIYSLRHENQVWKGVGLWRPWLGLALLQTCRALYHEALPFVYAPHRFVVVIYGGDNYDPLGVERYAGPLDRTNTLLRSVHSMEIALDIRGDEHVDGVLRRLRLLAAALGEDGEEGAALLKTWTITILVHKPAKRQFVAGRIKEVLEQLNEEEGDGGGVGLFGRMLLEGVIESFPCPVAGGSCYNPSCKCWQ